MMEGEREKEKIKLFAKYLISVRKARETFFPFVSKVSWK